MQEEKTSEEVADKEYEGIVQYNVSFDFSKLVAMLKEDRRAIKVNSEEISELRKIIAEMKEENKGTHKRLDSLDISQERNNVLLTNT